jgi:hypothetical protein
MPKLTVERFERSQQHDPGTLSEIAAAAPPSRLGMAIHVFQIEADDRSFRVFVEGTEVKIIDER